MQVLVRRHTPTHQRTHATAKVAKLVAAAAARASTPSHRPQGAGLVRRRRANFNRTGGSCCWHCRKLIAVCKLPFLHRLYRQVRLFEAPRRWRPRPTGNSMGSAISKSEDCWSFTLARRIAGRKRGFQNGGIQTCQKMGSCRANLETAAALTALLTFTAILWFFLTGLMVRLSVASCHWQYNFHPSLFFIKGVPL
ncbi:hypothetical protein BDZ88DRAFT_25256 [Geranomyces variabilis]|nr:hypothetical protein BDZ88DRAFT_25256 [Geranomyces variabilis]